MCLLFETIKVCNRKLHNIEWHKQRIRRSRKELFGTDNLKDFEKFFEDFSIDNQNLFKLKITYSEKIQHFKLNQYTLQTKKRINFFELPSLKYPYKYLNREVFEEIEKKLTTEEIGVITQNGYLTDCTYANVVLSDGVELHTPLNCLLSGTKRSKLISEKRIIPKLIHINELSKYKYLQIINAIIDLEDNIKIEL